MNTNAKCAVLLALLFAGPLSAQQCRIVSFSGEGFLTWTNYPANVYCGFLSALSLDECWAPAPGPYWNFMTSNSTTTVQLPLSAMTSGTLFLRLVCSTNPLGTGLPQVHVPLANITVDGATSDWQQPLAVVLTQSEGVSRIHETVYEDRFGYTEDLNLMGARIKILEKCLGNLPCRFQGKDHSHSAEIHGPTALKGSSMRVRDLRSGIAHVIAALAAEGESTIEGVEEIDRGYVNIDKRLQALGADIKRVA